MTKKGSKTGKTTEDGKKDVDVIKLSPKITAEIQRIKGELMNLQNVAVGMNNQINSICKAVQDTLGKNGEYILSKDDKSLVLKKEEK